MDEPTLGEINRVMIDLKAEIRGLRGEVLRADLYQANRTADDQRISGVEKKMAIFEEERAAVRKLVYGAFMASGASVVIQLILQALQGHHG